MESDTWTVIIVEDDRFRGGSVIFWGGMSYDGLTELYESASVAQLDARLTGDQEVAGSTPPLRQHSFVESLS